MRADEACLKYLKKTNSVTKDKLPKSVKKKSGKAKNVVKKEKQCSRRQQREAISLKGCRSTKYLQLAA